MSTLTNRAEAALVGALLNDTTTENLPSLDWHDFSHPGLAEVYRALTYLRSEHPTLHGEDLVRATADRANTPGLDAARLGELREDCPRPEHVTAYARIVATNSFHRQLTHHADNLTHSVTQGDSDAHLKRIAEVITRQAQAYTTMDKPGTLTHRQPQDDPASEAQQLEEQVLAGLIQYPEQGNTLAAMLPSEAITDPHRREIFETAISLASCGDHIDEAILDWELARNRVIQHLATGVQPEPSPHREPDTVLLHRLAHTPVQANTAITAARTLLSNQVHNQLKQHTNTTTPNPSRRPEPLATFNPSVKPPPIQEPPDPALRINGSQGGPR
ncbi:DnaB-like helicase N-terminal domain-containing protein [Stackebrandtia nassauensis]|uniref:DNA helicase DnaB-like N-terminal domain-containing protein n=1 Tax=Stackebrandtia nassauensis (strain DSM 44728 / CIP 108903 / NRRL B-16338 / NBRC 102104 / LLR-40K-21) TaxID=446470 RepID=D3PVU9_STANL|nr:DnaB-like helicase N-terminal domain-containing protein [Stackebrandtia nassauensis]ADD45070.1 hypothetical protein Snas_5438 [Stackebrandtia nassauensis DSM 44728]